MQNRDGILQPLNPHPMQYLYESALPYYSFLDNIIIFISTLSIITGLISLPN